MATRCFVTTRMGVHFHVAHPVAAFGGVLAQRAQALGDNMGSGLGGVATQRRSQRTEYLMGLLQACADLRRPTLRTTQRVFVSQGGATRMAIEHTVLR